MLSTVPHPVLDRLSLGFVILALAVPLTYVQVTRPSLEDIQSLLGVTAHHVVGSSSQPHTAFKQTTSSTPKPVTSPSPIATPSPTSSSKPPIAKPTAKTAITSSFVNLRAGKSVTTPIIATLEAGTTVQLRDDGDTTWQGVTYQGKNGYIYRSYLQY